MLVRLSTKGQLVIPKKVRDALGLEPGARLSLTVEGGRLVLEPLQRSPAEALYGRAAGADLLGALEAEHREEVERDRKVRP